MSKRRVVVTGMGVVSCFGMDVQKFYESLLEGKSGVKPITHFPCDDFSTRIAACVDGFEIGDYLDKKQARRLDPCISYGVVAAKKALEDAKLFDLTTLDKTRSGVVLGSGMGGMSAFSDGVEALVTRGHKKMSPFFVPMIITNMASGITAIETGFMGPNYSISTACATANNSIIAAANHIRSGECDVMITGGVEASISPVGMGGFCAIKALSKRNEEPQKASRPWNKDRDGFVMGEGAGVLILESLEHAQKRGAYIYGEYLGGGLSCDAHHMTELRPDGKGVALCVKKALQDASREADSVDYINAHATSTPVGDMAEIGALKQVFTDRKNVKIAATKSMIGHGLGAAGGFEAIATLKSIEKKEIPPTINLDQPEEDLEFEVPTKRESFEIQLAISNSFGFGGHNATIVLAPFKE